MDQYVLSYVVNLDILVILNGMCKGGIYRPTTNLPPTNLPSFETVHWSLMQGLIEDDRFKSMNKYNDLEVSFSRWYVYLIRFLVLGSTMHQHWRVCPQHSQLYYRPVNVSGRDKRTIHTNRSRLVWFKKYENFDPSRILKAHITAHASLAGYLM